MTADEEGKGYLIRPSKRQNQKSPEFVGQAVLLGHQIRLAAWVDTSRTGRKFLSIRLEDRGVAPVSPANQLELGA